jgi:tetratricopeptide (TPR) repeat protein
MLDSRKNSIIVGLAVAAALAAIFVHTSPGAKSGLYEHIRKAERYFEAGKYDRGIHYLHKAYEKALDSELIEDELAKGYLRYARYLNSRGEVDLAIEKAAMAYEMIPSSLPVMNDLAYYLSVRAVERSFRGDLSAAREDLEIASMLAAGSKTIKTNISNYLFNRSIDARDRKDIPTLLLALKTSYALRPRFETMVFLGSVFYDIRELEKSLFYLEKALSLRPENKRVKDSIERTEKEILIREKEKILRTPDFDVIMYGENTFDTDLLEEHLLDVYDSVGRDLDYYPPPGTKIIIYEEKDFRDIFQKQGTVLGIFDGNIKIALKGTPSDILATGVVAHEYTHALLSAITENKCPIWLHEGIAVYEQSRYFPMGLGNLENALEKGARLSLSDVEETFENMRDPASLALAYESAHSAVLFMLDEWGWPALRELIHGLREYGHFANAFDEVFYISVPMFEDMWNSFVRKKLDISR